ncbi:MAG: hypothetical protein ABWZ41_08125 [Burkholderiales bacterium]
MQPRNILIHAVVALAALHAAVTAVPASAVMPVPAGATLADEGAAYPGWAVVVYPGPYVAYPEGEVLVFAPVGAGNEEGDAP